MENAKLICKAQVIENYYAFVDRQQRIGNKHVYSMAYAYLESLCEIGIISYTETTSLLEYADEFVE